MGASGTGCQREECSDSETPTHDLDEVKGVIYFTVLEMKSCTKTEAIKAFLVGLEGDQVKR
jgi:hypothetical protein